MAIGRRSSRLIPRRPPRKRAPFHGGGSEAASRPRRSFQLAFGGPGRPTLAINPADDRTFVAWAMRAVAAWEAGSGRTPARLEVALRRHFPAAVVRRRDLAGEVGEMWYVYRDGAWVPPPRRG